MKFPVFSSPIFYQFSSNYQTWVFILTLRASRSKAMPYNLFLFLLKKSPHFRRFLIFFTVRYLPRVRGRLILDLSDLARLLGSEPWLAKSRYLAPWRPRSSERDRANPSSPFGLKRHDDWAAWHAITRAGLPFFRPSPLIGSKKSLTIDRTVSISNFLI